MDSPKEKAYESMPEDLDAYIHVSSPGVLAVVVSLLVMLISVIVWGFAGTLPVTETVTGLVVDYATFEKNKPEFMKEIAPEEKGGIVVFCFVDASRYNGQAIKEFDDDAVLKLPDQSTCKGTIELRVGVPLSMQQAQAILFDNEWVTERCVAQNYNWWLIIRPEEDLSKYAFTLAEVTLLTEEVPPIQFLM